MKKYLVILLVFLTSSVLLQGTAVKEIAQPSSDYDQAEGPIWDKAGVMLDWGGDKAGVMPAFAAPAATGPVEDLAAQEALLKSKQSGSVKSAGTEGRKRKRAVHLKK